MAVFFGGGLGSGDVAGLLVFCFDDRPRFVSCTAGELVQDRVTGPVVIVVIRFSRLLCGFSRLTDCSRF